MPDIR